MEYRLIFYVNIKLVKNKNIDENIEISMKI